MAQLSRIDVYSQVRYFKTIPLSRTRILYEMKRRFGGDWDKNKIAWIDAAIKGVKPMQKNVPEVLETIVRSFEKKYPLKKRAGAWTHRTPATSSADQEKKRLAAKKFIESHGFRLNVVRGDVGNWVWLFVYTKKRGTNIAAWLYAKDKSPRSVRIEIRER